MLVEETARYSLKSTLFSNNIAACSDTKDTGQETTFNCKVRATSGTPHFDSQLQTRFATRPVPYHRCKYTHTTLDAAPASQEYCSAFLVPRPFLASQSRFDFNLGSATTEPHTT
jgi:hypothetical protein